MFAAATTVFPRACPQFWLQVVTELKNRGVQDIFIACIDGLKGFPEAIEAVYPPQWRQP
jgi:transposase-like protein